MDKFCNISYPGFDMFMLTSVHVQMQPVMHQISNTWVFWEDTM